MLQKNARPISPETSSTPQRKNSAMAQRSSLKTPEFPPNESQPALPKKPVPRKPRFRGTVLVVDDSPTVRKLVNITLKKQRYQVVSAADGMEALGKLNDALPDLILLDITMPRMDGYQLCKIIKGNKEIQHIPVIMLSGKDGFFDKVRGRMAGSTEYMTKPFKPKMLLQVVGKHIKKQHLSSK